MRKSMLDVFAAALFGAGIIACPSSNVAAQQPLNLQPTTFRDAMARATEQANCAKRVSPGTAVAQAVCLTTALYPVWAEYSPGTLDLFDIWAMKGRMIAEQFNRGAISPQQHELQGKEATASLVTSLQQRAAAQQVARQAQQQAQQGTTN